MRKVVVLAEDNEDLGQVVKSKLEHAALKVIWKKDGGEAWDAIVSQHPALAILDANLPSVDGFELLRRIKASDNMRQTPVIMVSALGYGGYVGDALRNGASDFVVRPFRAGDLLSRVKHFLKPNPHAARNGAH